MHPELANRLSSELIAVIQSKRMSDYLLQQGAQPSGIVPAEFSNQIKEDIVKWNRVAQSAGIRPE
jgi:tripartite-type tricarboxylate transporter receptor subunit TctC